jgi:hypothetical protein
MKNLLILIIPFLLFGCYSDTLDNAYEYKPYNYTVTISGDCSFITIHNNTDTEDPGFIYNDLPINYIQTGIIYVRSDLDTEPSIKRRVVKHTDDASTISMQIEIEGQATQNYSCSTAYCEISTE